MVDKDRSIVSSCPCCEAELVLDLESGEIYSSDQVVIPEVNKSPYRSGITVQHVTPGWNVYCDPTHLKQEPLLQQPTAPFVAKDEEKEVILPKLSEDQITALVTAYRHDLTNRGFTNDDIN